jgi:hypothetical protein
MSYRTAKDTKTAMIEYGDNWRIPFMEFVDDFRRLKDPGLIEEAFDFNNDLFDPLLA